jgi:hypothetical protein
MGNKQTGYFVYNSAVEGPDFNYHQDYNQGPYNHEDYTGFYAGIGIAAIVFLLILLLNLIFCTCSPWRKYWLNRKTGNRFLLPVYNMPPKDQEPLHL